MSDFGVAVQDDGYRRALLDPSTLLDTPHHDVPERHEIGKALLAPGLPKGTSLTPSAGISPAPARSDHQHGAYSSVGARGILAQGALVPEPCALPAGATTNLGSINFTPPAGRTMRLVFTARAMGPATSGQNTTLAIKTIGSNLIRAFDHWFAANTQWSSMNCEMIFAGNGLACSWTLQASNVAVAATIYPFDFYVEDLGAPN